ncbi:MAG TPA: J domain-containing protein [Desulfobacterales bacterium]|nr:J domain-containing protein [Desulfobacterales bacterium]
MITIAEQDLFKACRVLFGGEIQISRGFLEYLQLNGVKTAYRRRARETHPDMLTDVGESAIRRGADLFQGVQQAYESLRSYLDARERGLAQFQQSPPTNTAASKPTAAARRWPQNKSWANRPQAARKKQASPRRQTGQSSSHRPGWTANYRQASPSRQIPPRKLLFGHYLFYSGVTNWQTIVNALIWQRTKRPRLGEIGKSFGWLTSSDIVHILKSRRLSDSFGCSAVKLGLLTENQVRLMVFKQQRQQKKFGEYFVHHKLLTHSQLEQLIKNFRYHNTSVSINRQAS